MATVTFDTRKAKENLTNVGVEDRQATAIVDLTRERVSENVATKGNISDLKVEIANLKAQTMLGLCVVSGLIVAATGTIVGTLISSH